MRILGHLFMILFIIVVISGFYLGTELSKGEIDYSNPLRNMPLNFIEFNLSIAMIVWLSGSSLLIAAMVSYWMDQVIESLAGMRSVLKEIAGNTKQSGVQQGKKSEKEPTQEAYFKPGDSPQFPRCKGECDQSYWDRVNRGQYITGPPKINDNPQFPRLKDELDHDYWERVN